METYLRNQAFSIATTTYKITAGAINYLSGELNTNSNIPKDLPTYSLQDVAAHDTMNDCWVVIFDKVYDIVEFINKHPGGCDVLCENAGRDATNAFRSVGHSECALRQLSKYCIGLLVENERMYSQNNTYLNNLANIT
uniref:Cytochrome b5 heme-binding domain-containing protein n=1 Tax=Strigamia maritima TaxID=126957 RepID=T1JK60_STRMM